MLSDTDLITKTNLYTQENKFLSWYYTISTFTLWISSIVIVILSTSHLISVTFSIIISLLNIRLFSLYHDFNHKAILDSSIIAEVIMTLYGFLILIPKNTWNIFHQHHHKNNSKFSPIVYGNYPILEKKEYQKLKPAQKKNYLISRHPLTILFGYITIFMVSFCFNSFKLNPKKHWDAGLSLVIHFLIILFLADKLGITKALLIFIIPMFIMCAFGGYIFYAQHNCPGIRIDDKNWTYVKAALYSSSFIKMNKLGNWITANIGYHHIHHVNSKIPFYRLPEAMKNISYFQNPIITQLKLDNIKVNLSLKVWDSKKNKLTGIEDK